VRWWSGRTRPQCVAIDISHGAVKLMATTAARRLIAVKRVPLADDSDAQLVTALQQACPLTLSRSCRVVVALHAPVMTKQLTIAQPLSSAATHLHSEAAHYFNYPESELYVDFEKLPQVTTQRLNSVRLVAAQRSEVDRLVSLMAQAGLRVTQVDVARFALVNALRRTVSMTHHVMVIELSQRQMRLGLLAETAADEHWHTHPLVGDESQVVLLELLVSQLQLFISDNQSKKNSDAGVGGCAASAKTVL